MTNYSSWTDDGGNVYSTNLTNPLPVNAQPAPVGSFWSYVAPTSGIAPSTAQTAAKAAAGAAVRNYIQSAQISHATLSAAVECVIQDGSTALWRGVLQTAATDSGAYTLNFEPPLRGSLNTAVNYTFSGSATGGVYVNLQGFTGA